MMPQESASKGGNPTNRPRGRSWLIATFGVSLIVAIGVLVALLPEKVPPEQQQVRDLLDLASSNRYRGDEAVNDMGPKAIPEMRKWVEYKESSWHVWFRTNVWKRMPPVFRKRMEDPVKLQKRHAAAVMTTADLGPTFARPLTSALCKAAEDTDWITRATAVSALSWSVPESAAAKKRIEEWLQEPGQLGINFGPGPQTSEEMWVKLPEMAPLQIPLLRCMVSVYQAAGALGAMGTNGAVAIPALIEVCENGFASPQIPAKPGPFAGNGGLFTNSITWQHRQPGYSALARIGIATPEVIALLKGGLADTNAEIQMTALYTWQAVHQQMTPEVKAFVTGVKQEAGGTLSQMVAWAGSLGENGRELLPWLQQFTSLEHNQSLPMASPMPGSMQNVSATNASKAAEALRWSAVYSICRIAPEELPKYLADFEPMLGPRKDIADMLSSAKGQAAVELMAWLQPMLQGTNVTRAMTAAYVITGLSPGHEEAMKLLREGMKNGSLTNRLNAGLILWRRTGETKELLALCQEGIITAIQTMPPQSSSTPAAAVSPPVTYYKVLQVLQEMGPAARPVPPDLKKMLWSRNRNVRDGVARLLLRIAPEELPAIQ